MYRCLRDLLTRLSWLYKLFWKKNMREFLTFSGQIVPLCTKSKLSVCCRETVKMSTGVSRKCISRSGWQVVVLSARHDPNLEEQKMAWLIISQRGAGSKRQAWQRRRVSHLTVSSAWGHLTVTRWGVSLIPLEARWQTGIVVHSTNKSTHSGGRWYFKS